MKITRGSTVDSRPWIPVQQHAFRAWHHVCRWGWVALFLAGSLELRAANPSSGLRIEVISAYNFVVDSNVESPSTFAPRSAYLGAKFFNDGTNDLKDVFAYIGNYLGGTSNTPGIYPRRVCTENPSLVGDPLASPSNSFGLTHEGGDAGTADATRYLGTIPAGKSVTVYWLVSYPNLDANGKTVTGGIKPHDDLWLEYDIWGTASRASTPVTADVTRKVTMRNEISAMANKIFPNSANKVPLEYQTLLALYAPAWTNSANDGTPGTVIKTEGIWYDLGNVGAGFDNNGDLVPDRNAWLQPVGDPVQFNPSYYRLTRTYAMVVVKLNDGTNVVYKETDQLYFENIPANNIGAVGYVLYEFTVLNSGFSALMPYQEVASGYDNEKFNGDYGATLGYFPTSPPPHATIVKTADVAITDLGSNIVYTMVFTNAGSLPLGNPSVGLPLVVQDAIPTGTTYVAGSATNGLILPTNVAAYTLLFSTNKALSWLTAEPVPASRVTDIQWWLSDVMPTSAWGRVGFEVTVASPFSNAPPLVYNLAGLAFGNNTPFATDDATTLVRGNNSIGDTVFLDTGSGTNYGNGVQGSGEIGASNQTVKLYFDLNGNGAVDASDYYYGQTSTATNGIYLFSKLPDGRYVVVLDKTSTNWPTGHTPTTPEAVAVNLDATSTNSSPVDFLNADFGLAPALALTKELVGSSPVYEDRQATFRVTVTNRFPASGAGGSSLVVTNWATELDTARNGGNSPWLSPSNALSVPDGLEAYKFAENNPDLMGVKGFGPVRAGTVTNVQLVVRMRRDVSSDDNFRLHLYTNATTSVKTLVSNFLGSAVSASLTDYTMDITSLFPSLAWSVLTNSTIQLDAQKSGSSETTFYVDAVGYRITTDHAVIPATTNTTLYPVPLNDTYDADLLQFVSATPAQTTASTNGTPPLEGTLYWNNVGPIYPGGSTSVLVTFKVLAPPNNVSAIVTNRAFVNSATFSNGLPANPDSALTSVTVLATAKLGDYVWRDVNGDGQTNAEYGIAGVSVVLTPTNGVDAGAGVNVPITNVTDASGYYLFAGLIATNYTVTVLTNTLPGTGWVNTWDRDGNSNNTTSVTITNAPGGGPVDVLDADFGYRATQGLIEGYLWHDLNRNASNWPDSGEDWLSGVTVILYSNGVQVATTNTSAGGYYRFTGNFIGSYSVGVSNNTGPLATGTWVQSFDTDGILTTNTVSFTMVSGGYGRGDFSYYLTGTYAIGDLLFYDWNGDGVTNANEAGIPDITVYLYEDANSNGVVDVGTDALIAVTVTDTNGWYGFTNRPAGPYQVVVNNADPDLPPSYTVTADPYGAMDGRSALVLSNASNYAQDFGYRPTGSASIGDTVWRDLDGNGVQMGPTETGISNITVWLYADFNADSNYVLLATSVTDTSGMYLFTNLPNGSYRVVVDSLDADLPVDGFGSRYYPTTATTQNAVITNNVSLLDKDFGFRHLGAIGDTVFWDANRSGSQDSYEPGVSNVTVSLYIDTNTNRVYDAGTDTLVSNVVTGTNGYYVFSGLFSNRYFVVVETNSGPVSGYECTADPDADGDPAGTNRDGRCSVNLGMGQVFLGADFGFAAPGVIGDRLWVDMDNDGVQDLGELGIAYVPVVLWRNGAPIATNITDGDGYYLFVNLTNATYQVQVLTNSMAYPFPPYLVPVYDADGTDDNVTTNVVLSGAGSHVTSVGGLSVSNFDLAIDFGYRYAGSNVLSGTVGMDVIPYDGLMNGTNVSGVASGEVAFAGVEVYAYLWNDINSNGVVDSGETTPLGSTLTAANGDYRFEGLPTGAVSNKYIIAMGKPYDDLVLTTTNGATSPDYVVVTTNATGSFVSGYQVVGIRPENVNIDFAFAPSAPFDYGDLPDSYKTLLTSGGARHKVKAVPDLYLGSTVDQEFNGVPGALANGDNLAGTNDEDGVTTSGVWINGTNATISVTVGAGSGWLVGYIDFNRDGDFMDAGELAVSRAVSNTVYTLPVRIPAGSIQVATNTIIYARFRLLPEAPALPAIEFEGLSLNGEVEDYRWDLGSIGDRVWLDRDADGVQDAGEPGLAGVTVFADLDGDGVRDANEPYAVTDSSGNYAFGGLPAGSYTVRVDTATLPGGLRATYDLDGGADSRASVSMATGQVRTDVDFGFAGNGLIGDRVWLDENSDGVQDAGEDGIANVGVGLYDTNGILLSATVTDSEGRYAFMGLTLDSYVVRVDTNSMSAGLAANQTFDPDTTTNHATTVTLTTAQPEVLTADFGYNWAPPPDVFGNKDTGAIGDRIWIDADGDGHQDPGEAGLSNVTVRIYRDADTNGTYETLVAVTNTDAAGLYIFDGLVAGAYSVVVNGGSTPTGYTQTGDPDYFGATLPAGARDNKTTTPIVLAPGDVFVNADFGYQPSSGTSGSIGDLVWFDANGDGTNNASEYGIAGVTVALIRDLDGDGVWDAGEPIIATTITGTNGLYAFSGLPVTDGTGTDDYLVWVNDTATVLAGLTPTFDFDGTAPASGVRSGYGISAVADLAPAGTTAHDFGYTAPGQTAGKGLIGDTIFLDRNADNTPDTGEGLEGVTVRLYDSGGVTLLGTTVTDENGHYYFGGLDTNSVTYVVKVDTNTLPFAGLSNTYDPESDSNSQSSVTLTGVNPVDLARDFGYRDTSSPNAIGGTIWEDRNADGTLVGGETNRFAGVTVVLLNTNGNIVGTTVTDAQGNYSFTNLPDGTYRVDVTDEGNVLAGYWHSDGTNDNADGNSQVDPYTVAVSGGTNNTTGDFGYYVDPAALGNRTWLDSDKDGIQDVGETAVTNVTIRLTIRYPDGTTNVMATVSDTNGFFSFGNLLLDEQFATAGWSNDMSRPMFWLSVASFPTGLVSTLAFQGGNVWMDSGRFSGTDAYPVKGVTAMGLNTVDPTQEPLAASFDFGFVEKSTLARLVGFRGYTRDGETIIEWQTAEEIGTAGYYLERMTGAGEYERINGELIPAQPLAMDVATYEQADAGARSGGSYVYRLIEVEVGGTLRYLGPYQVTIDGEVLSLDEWSRMVFGATGAQNPAVAGAEADPDGDRLSNLAEFMAGSNPMDKDSALKIEGVGGLESEGFRLRWQSQSNRFYRIEWTPNLLEGYQPLQTGIRATPPENEYLDAAHTGDASMFYRIRLE